MEDLDRRAGIKKMFKILTMSKQRRKSTSKAVVKAKTIAREESQFKKLYKEETRDQANFQTFMTFFNYAASKFLLLIIVLLVLAANASFFGYQAILVLWQEDNSESERLYYSILSMLTILAMFVVDPIK